MSPRRRKQRKQAEEARAQAAEDAVDLPDTPTTPEDIQRRRAEAASREHAEPADVPLDDDDERSMISQGVPSSSEEEDPFLAARRTTKPARPGLEWRRLVPLAVVVGLVAAGLALDDRVGPPEPPGVDRGSDEGVLMPVAAPDTALRSTWYCAGGTAAPDGDAAHRVVVLNASDRDLSGTVTVYPGQVHPLADGAPELPEPVEVPLEIGAHQQEGVDLGEVIEAPYAAALVEMDGGEVVVEHEVTGPAGRDASPCSSAASSTWFFADGTTVQGAQETLAIFNPFPDDAVVDITFATDDGRREPEDYDGLVVPSGQVVAADVTATVTVREHVSASVTARTGRVVTDRLQSFDGTNGAEGLTVTLGAPEPTLGWAWSAGVIGGGVSERYTIYNPTDERAEVSLEVQPDDESITIEPFELTIPPRSFGIVDDEQLRQRLGEETIAHGTVLRSSNVVPVVAERRTGGSPESSRPGVDLTLGVPRLSTEVVVVTAAQDGSIDDFISVFNPSGASITVTVQALTDGGLQQVGDVLTVEPLQRGTFAPSDLGERGTPLVVQLSAPAVVERTTTMPSDGDVSSAAAVALAGTLAPIPAPS
jgi:hypothetical protein